MIRLAFFWVVLPCFCMLIFLLSDLGLVSKSTSLSPGFCVCRPRQYGKICCKFDLISGFFVFSCLIVWADGINKCGWCLTGGRRCWLKSPHQIPSVSLLSHHSLHFRIYYIAQFLPGMPCPLYCCCNWWGDGLEWGWLIYIRVWVGGTGGGYHLIVFVCFCCFCCFFSCFCIFLSQVLSPFN